MLDLIFKNGPVLVYDPRFPQPEAVGIRGGHILAVGTLDHVMGQATAATRTFDLGGRTLIPGFTDAHVHVWKVGHLLTTMLDLRGTRSLGEMGSAMRSFAARLPEGAWLQARGYNEATLAEGRHPTRADLDRVAPDRPACLIRTCAHIAVANSRALELAGIGRDTAPPPGGAIERDDRGEPTGVLHETALGLVTRAIPPPTRQDYERMILAAAQHQLSLGITGATDPAVTPELIDAYKALDARGELPVRMDLLAIRRPDGGSETLPLPEKYQSRRLHIAGVKFFTDGGLSGATAALSVPYRHAPTQGVLRFETAELLELALEAHRAGYRIATHAIGDAAIEQALGVYEALERDCEGPIHRIEHLGLPTAEHLRRMAALDTIAVSQPTFLHDLGANFERYLPVGWEDRPYPYRAMRDAGVRLAFSSDAPVVRDDNPLLGMRCALTRKSAEGRAIGPDQALTGEEALLCYTAYGSMASGGARGLIARLYDADLVVLSGNPLETLAEELTNLKVDATFVAGRQVFER